MPDLKIDEQQHGMEWVRSVMLFPTDTNLRETFHASRTLRRQTLDLPRNTFVLDRAFVELLLAGSSENEMRSKHVREARKGVVAGELLAAIYVMDRFSVSEPSINKAIYWLQRNAEAGGKWADGPNLPLAEQTIRDAWNAHRGVSHLWGAFAIHGFAPFLVNRHDYFSAFNLEVLLAVAAELLRFGLTYVPPRARPPVALLDPSTTWRLPDWVVPISGLVQSPPNEFLNVLKDYQAPRNSAWS